MKKRYGKRWKEVFYATENKRKSKARGKGKRKRSRS
jgi:hypothetical protein